MVAGLHTDPTEVDRAVLIATSGRVVRADGVNLSVLSNFDLEGIGGRAFEAQTHVVVSVANDRQVVRDLAWSGSGVDEGASLGDAGGAFVARGGEVSLILPGQGKEEIVRVRNILQMVLEPDAPHHEPSPLGVGHGRSSRVPVERNQRGDRQRRHEPQCAIFLDHGLVQKRDAGRVFDVPPAKGG